MLAEQKLQSVADQLSKGVVPPQESVRTFLLWFDVQRRGPRIIREIREILKRYGLQTSPDFEFAYIDGLISFSLVTETSDPSSTGIAVADPTYRIGRLESAHRVPITVKPDSTLQQAVTLMLTNDFSQLPVMVGEREVKGVVSWKTIGSRLALKRACPAVRDCMEPAHVLPIDDSLFNAIKTIAENDYVLVQASDKKICGIITASDFNEQFRKLAEPFLLVGEIENGLRQMLHGKFTATELEAAKAPGDDQRTITSVSDLTFGEYQRLVESEERWSKIQLEIDRVEFVSRLNRVREIRNDVMHFDPDGLEDTDLFILREFAQFLKRLRDVGAVG
jgi:CBS domain-containing protein